jgi:ketopantoate hydroxymethyltransferase
MIDLTMVSKDIYAAVCKAVDIPVIGGQSGSESDGKIYVGYAITGYGSAILNGDASPDAAIRSMYTVIEKAVKAVHDNNWS